MQHAGYHVDWRELAADASLALAHLDAERLEELEKAARALDREFRESSPAQRLIRRNEVNSACDEIAVLGRVLAVTDANLWILRRAGRTALSPLEYVQPGSPMSLTEAHRGYY